MTHVELKQAAIDYLVKAFKHSDDVIPPSQMVQAAVSIVLTPEPSA